MAVTVRLERWSTCFGVRHRLCLRGDVDGDPARQVVTSGIVAVDGRRVMTRSGIVYELRSIDPDYRRWLVETGQRLDEVNPIRLVEELSPAATAANADDEGRRPLKS